MMMFAVGFRLRIAAVAATKTATTTLGGAGTGVGGRFRITDTAAGDCFGSDGGRWLVGGRGGI